MLGVAAVGLAPVLTGGGASAAGGAQASAAASTSVREDFNGDGYQDLAVAAPDATIAGHARAGYIVVTYGSATGLKTSSHTYISQDTAGVPGVAETDDRFGGAVRRLDVTKDGRADLAVSAPQENNTGAVWSLRGTSTGLTATGSIAFNPVDLATPATNARFGASFANESGTYLAAP